MNTFVTPVTRNGRRAGLLAVLGALSAFGPLSMDMYLPSTPTIAANVHFFMVNAVGLTALCALALRCVLLIARRRSRAAVTGS